jgi:hypothetical protein
MHLSLPIHTHRKCVLPYHMSRREIGLGLGKLEIGCVVCVVCVGVTLACSMLLGVAYVLNYIAWSHLHVSTLSKMTAGYQHPFYYL